MSDKTGAEKMPWQFFAIATWWTVGFYVRSATLLAIGYYIGRASMSL